MLLRTKPIRETRQLFKGEIGSLNLTEAEADVLSASGLCFKACGQNSGRKLGSVPRHLDPGSIVP